MSVMEFPPSVYGELGGAEGVILSHFSPPSCPLGPDAHCPGGGAVDHLPTGFSQLLDESELSVSPATTVR